MNEHHHYKEDSIKIDKILEAAKEDIELLDQLSFIAQTCDSYQNFKEMSIRAIVGLKCISKNEACLIFKKMEHV